MASGTTDKDYFLMEKFALHLIVLIVSVATFALGQNFKYHDGTECECDSLRIVLDGDSTLSAEIPYLNGKVHGRTLMYYTSGVLMSDAQMVHGKFHGLYSFYSSKGLPSLEINYDHGLKHGISRTYYESGALRWEQEYNRDENVGEVKQYYESGQLKGIYPYLNGKVNGVVKAFSEDGILIGTTEYLDEVANGVEKEFYDSGKLKFEFRISNGKIGENIITFFNEDGSVQKKVKSKLIEEVCFTYELIKDDWVVVYEGRPTRDKTQCSDVFDAD